MIGIEEKSVSVIQLSKAIVFKSISLFAIQYRYQFFSDI